MHINLGRAERTDLVPDAVSGKRRDVRLAGLVTHYLSNAPRLQNPTDVRDDGQRIKTRLILMKKVYDGDVAITVARLVTNTHRKRVPPRATMRRVTVGEVGNFWQTPPRSVDAALDTSLDKFAGNVGCRHE